MWRKWCMLDEWIDGRPAEMHNVYFRKNNMYYELLEGEILYPKQDNKSANNDTDIYSIAWNPPRYIGSDS